MNSEPTPVYLGERIPVGRPRFADRKAARPVVASQPATPSRPLVDEFREGLDAPICLSWELTYACNLACVHCLSSSGRRDPRELTTQECFDLIDEFQRMKIFYVNIGGGEPMLRRDFFEIVEYSTAHDVGVKFSTNGTYIDRAAAERLTAMGYLDIQISIDGADADVNDLIRGEGSYRKARQAMDNLAEAGFGAFKISVVATRPNIDQLDGFMEIAESYGAQLRLTRLRPSGRAIDTWDDLHPTQEQQRQLYYWLLDRPHVMTGDSFFHLSALGEPLPGMNLCGAGRVVCLIDPIGDVYACPFVIHDKFLAGNIRDDGGFDRVWTSSEMFVSLRAPDSEGACTSCDMYDACGGGCMATKFFLGLDLSDPDPECVKGAAEPLLEARKLKAEAMPRPSADHSRPGAAIGRG